MGKSSYHSNKGLISVLFKDKRAFLRGSEADLVKVTKVLKENDLLDLKLKHISILDVFIIATGFVLRLFAGSSVTNIELSLWIIMEMF